MLAPPAEGSGEEMRRRGTASQTPPDEVTRGRCVPRPGPALAGLVLALGLALVPCAPAVAQQALLPAPGAACARCEALVVLPDRKSVV